MIPYAFPTFWGENGLFTLATLIAVLHPAMLCVRLPCDYACRGSHLLLSVTCRNFFLSEATSSEVIWTKGFLDRHNNFGSRLVRPLRLFCETRIGHILGHGVENTASGLLSPLRKMRIVPHLCSWVKVLINILSEHSVLCFQNISSSLARRVELSSYCGHTVEERETLCSGGDSWLNLGEENVGSAVTEPNIFAYDCLWMLPGHS